MKPEQLCAGLILLVRLETERQVERYKRVIPSRDLLRNIFSMVSTFDLWGEGINSYLLSLAVVLLKVVGDV